MTTLFDKVFAALEADPLSDFMKAEVEGSPYHREANVWVHTEMVCAKAEELTYGLTEDQKDILMLAALFHDAGKPMSRVEKFREDRGNYRAYYGHDRASARLVEDFFYRHSDLGVDTKKVLAVMFLVEQHQSYKIVDKVKQQRIVDTLAAFGYGDLLNVLERLMIADSKGRIIDDVANYQKMVDESKAFVDQLRSLTVGYTDPNGFVNKPCMTVLIGAAGSGKSTYSARFNREVFSMDALRLKMANTDDARVAFRYANDHKQEFSELCQKEFAAIVKKDQTFIVDNVNGSRKSRAQWLEVARRNGYFIEAVMFPISVDELVKRNQNRGHKNVPVDAVRHQYFGIDFPQIGEFDYISVEEQK